MFDDLRKNSYGNIQVRVYFEDLDIVEHYLTRFERALDKVRIVGDKLKRYIPNIKHAFVSQKDATKNDNIGVENANDKAILEALKNVITANQDIENRFDISDLIDNGFVSGNNSKERRIMLGDLLKIGYYNAKQLLKALNSFNISREQFEEAVKKINEKDM